MRRGLLCLTLSFLFVFASVAQAQKPVKYCRYEYRGDTSYGVVEGASVVRIDGDLFGKWKKTDDTVPLKAVKLLSPSARPSQVLAMAGNYKSHLNDGSRTTIVTVTTKIVTDANGDSTSESTTETETRIAGQVPEKFQTPQPFFKSPSSVVGPGENIVLPKGAEVVHYEAELVVVIGKRAQNVSKENALEYVLGVTCGNDVSARKWQKGDVQWWRAKGSDTFGPCGPVILSGVNYDDLLVQLRLNGEVRQKESTSQLIHDVASTVSFISKHTTLQPGDLIFTGTSGKTDILKAGDTVEVDIAGVGVLKNKVVAEK
ncbi:MAG: fumarylacetoacetate hydrolase family protein [Pirellulaceae bacterium]|jgi:2-keto-4-pentenoate hydratase/2-oxohepta-3-ene-1,7-dioic acid hydratase in catechol pathway|nr:fumarylacetoacetate hydrolase family protein [Pirellulaceae bacterium]MDP7019032.1 fumarylacetoacetate hydrolase family protein [Pirellulaceae bacterium]